MNGRVDRRTVLGCGLVLSAMLLGSSTRAAEHDIGRETLSYDQVGISTGDPSVGRELTGAEEALAVRIQESHYRNIVRALSGLRISAQDKDDAKKTVFCDIGAVHGGPGDYPKDWFVGELPSRRRQIEVLIAMRQEVEARLSACGARMMFTPQSFRDLHWQTAAMFLKNSGTTFCKRDSDCGAFKIMTSACGEGRVEAVVWSGITDDVFIPNLRFEMGRVFASMWNGGVQLYARRYGEMDPEVASCRETGGEPPAPKAVCRRSACEAAAKAD